jgi:hypothetical protein
MKAISTLISIFAFSYTASAQVQCIKCYNQNTRVLTDTNNLIVNGGFEITNCPATSFAHDSSFCPNSTWYHCDISNWICSGGGSQTYAHMCDSTWSTIVEGKKAVYFGSSYCNTCSSLLSDTSCILDQGCIVTGIPAGYPNHSSIAGYGDSTGLNLSQTVTGLISGANYTLEFWAGGEWESFFYNRGLFAVDVGFGRIMLRDTCTSSGIIGTRFVIVFCAISSSHTIKFTNWGRIGGNTPPNCTELVLDDVRLFASNGEGYPCATAINSHTENGGVRVFPNLFTSEVTLNYPDDYLQIKVFDLTGNLLLATTGNEDAINQSLNKMAITLPKGIYLLRLATENGSDFVNKKLIKM